MSDAVAPRVIAVVATTLGNSVLQGEGVEFPAEMGEREIEQVCRIGLIAECSGKEKSTPVTLTTPFLGQVILRVELLTGKLRL